MSGEEQTKDQIIGQFFDEWINLGNELEKPEKLGDEAVADALNRSSLDHAWHFSMQGVCHAQASNVKKSKSHDFPQQEAGLESQEQEKLVMKQLGLDIFSHTQPPNAFSSIAEDDDTLFNMRNNPETGIPRDEMNTTILLSLGLRGSPCLKKPFCIGIGHSGDEKLRSHYEDVVKAALGNAADVGKCVLPMLLVEPTSASSPTYKLFTQALGCSMLAYLTLWSYLNGDHSDATVGSFPILSVVPTSRALSVTALMTIPSFVVRQIIQREGCPLDISGIRNVSPNFPGTRFQTITVSYRINIELSQQAMLPIIRLVIENTNSLYKMLGVQAQPIHTQFPAFDVIEPSPILADWFYPIKTTRISKGRNQTFLVEEFKYGTSEAYKFIIKKAKYSFTAKKEFQFITSLYPALNARHQRLELSMGFVEDCLEALLNSNPTPEQLLPVMISTSRELCRIHEKGFIHSDIKPSNVRVDKLGTVFILDAEFSHEEVSDNDTMRECIGYSENFAPPEQTPKYDEEDDTEENEGAQATTQFEEEKLFVGKKSDVYSLGMTFICWLEGTRQPKKFLKNSNYERKFPSAIAALEPLINSIIDPEYSKRPTAAEVLQRLTELATQ